MPITRRHPLRQHRRLLLVAFLAAWPGGALESADAAAAKKAESPRALGPARDLVLWYLQPAERWLGALPVGNGRLGAMVWGGVEHETIGLDESTCWSGEPSLENVNPEARSLLAGGRAHDPLHTDGKAGVTLHGRLRAVADGGRILVRDGDGRLFVDNADAVTLLVALGTTFGDNDPVALCRQQIEAAAARSYDELCRRHVEDHRALFRRVAMDLGPSPHAHWPIDRRLEAVGQGEDDPALAGLMFQFARYLVIAASRSDSPLPMHLQGVWNDNRAWRMGWTCGYHLDINLQMEYWPAEVAALGECHEPLLRFVRDVLRPSGRHTAQAMYGARGWVAHTVSNAWGYSAPGWNYGWGLHPTGGVWVASHLWDHYVFTGDKQYLAETAYPVLKEAAEFFLDYLAEEPGTRRLVTGPACSPENWFYSTGDRRVRAAASMGPTCDTVLVGQLFDMAVKRKDR